MRRWLVSVARIHFTMKTLIFTIAFVLFAHAAEAPQLTDAQKVPILQAQRDLIALEAEKNALESRLRDLGYALIPEARAKVESLMKAAAPAGYTVKYDLTLQAEPKATAQ